MWSGSTCLSGPVQKNSEVLKWTGSTRPEESAFPMCIVEGSDKEPEHGFFDSAPVAVLQSSLSEVKTANESKGIRYVA
jgi:hypothetical protein